jgi:hypothetical protein
MKKDKEALLNTSEGLLDDVVELASPLKQAIGSEAWIGMLAAVADFKRNGYKITYWSPEEEIPELMALGTELVSQESEAVVIVTGNAKELKLPKLKCPHYHLIEVVPQLKIACITP